MPESSYPRDFVQVTENVFSKEFCDNCIAFMDNAVSGGFARSRQQDGHAATLIKDDQIFLAEIPMEYYPCQLLREFNEIFWGPIYNDYAKTYGILNNMNKHGVFSSKFQKTSVGGGYHEWHFEQSNDDPRRILAWILYLNDVDDGGETEFLYQSLRVKPKQGTMVVWPAYFTHTHRGNPPLTGDKYVATGWVEYCP